MSKWTDAVSGFADSNYYIVIRTAGDEREYSLVGHGFLGLSGGHEIDERDRGYIVAKIPKKDLYEKWKLFNGDEITFAFNTTGADFDYNHSGNLSDNYGGDTLVGDEKHIGMEDDIIIFNGDVEHCHKPPLKGRRIVLVTTMLLKVD